MTNLKTLVAILHLTLLSILVKAQIKIEPTIVVLYPNQLIASEEIREELKMYEEEIEVSAEDKEKFINPKLSSNWKLIREKEFEFRTNQDFLSRLTIATESNLIYKIIEYHSNPLIFPSRETANGTLKAYKTIADEHNVSWVINYERVELFKENNKKYAKVRLHLYNVVRDRLHINKEYRVDAHAADGEITCEDETWECVIHHLVPFVLTDLLHELERNRRFWHKGAKGEW